MLALPQCSGRSLAVQDHSASGCTWPRLDEAVVCDAVGTDNRRAVSTPSASAHEPYIVAQAYRPAFVHGGERCGELRDVLADGAG